MHRALFLAALLAAPVQAQQFQWPVRQVTATAVGAPLSGEFTRIAGAVLWPDGRVLVAEGSTSQLTLFTPEGRVRWTSGRTGAGPGEYRWIGSVLRCAAGAIGVYDLPLRRFTLLAADSGRVTATRLEDQSAGAVLVWCDSKSFVAGLPQPPLTGTPPPAPGKLFTQVIEVRVFTGGASRVLASGTNELFMASNAYSDVPFGERVALAGSGGTAYVCQTGAGTCTVLALPAGTSRTFTLALPRAKVTDAHMRYALDARLAGVGALPAIARQQFTSLLAELPRPDRFGAFDALQADAAGRLWVRTYRQYGAAEATWLVVSPQGTPVATVLLPSGAEPLSIGSGQLIARVRDEDGVPSVQRFVFPEP